MDNKNARPNLNTDKVYLDKVNALFKRTQSFGEIHFEYLMDVLKEFGVEADIYELYPKGEKEAVTKIIEEVFSKINSRENSQDFLQKIYRLWDYLSESDPLEKADLIFAFGGTGKAAMEEAIRLKLEGYAPKIMFSGKRASYLPDTGPTEAEYSRNKALEEGVLPEDILIERESINTPENIFNSATLLSSMDFLPKSIIAVSLPYHMRRGSLTMRAGFDWDFKLIRHAGPSAKYTRENYFKDIKGWSYVCFEYLKLDAARKMGHF